MRAMGLLIGGLFVLVGAAWLLWPTARGDKGRPVSQAVPSPAFHGVASCAASACHGRPDPGSPGGEWATWARLDPHAHAYDVLLQDRSRQIERKLNPNKGEPHPERNEVCLNCHVQPGIVQASRSARFQFADGVGCESCHGPSGKWLHEHARPGWTRSAANEPDAGMKDMRDLRVRAEVCSTCHIGKEDVAVNHDLIAAGHPRLRFEFAAYLANYPLHWPVSKDRDQYPDLEATAWAIGQTVSAAASLDLLAYRARSRDRIWPELADYDCYACHHDLAPRSWRQPDQAGKSSLGKLVLNDWYYAALPAVVGTFDIAPLAESMSSTNPIQERVAERAGKLLSPLQQRADGVTRMDRATRLALLGRLADLERSPARPSWDRDTQLYLGAAALTASRPDEQPSLRGAISALHSQLNRAFQGGEGEWLASPQRYDPNAVRQCWQEVREQLRMQPAGK